MLQEVAWIHFRHDCASFQVNLQPATRDFLYFIDAMCVLVIS